MLSSLTLLATGPSEELLRVSIIGLDTSHAINFTKIMHDPAGKAKMLGCRVVAAFPEGSRDIESSVSRVPRYTQTMHEMGVEIVDSIDTLLGKVDVVMLETNDGRPHLAQALPVLRSGKTLFIDKPIGAPWLTQLSFSSWRATTRFLFSPRLPSAMAKTSRKSGLASGER